MRLGNYTRMQQLGMQFPKLFRKPEMLLWAATAAVLQAEATAEADGSRRTLLQLAERLVLKLRTEVHSANGPDTLLLLRIVRQQQRWDAVLQLVQNDAVRGGGSVAVAACRRRVLRGRLTVAMCTAGGKVSAAAADQGAGGAGGADEATEV